MRRAFSFVGIVALISLFSSASARAWVTQCQAPLPVEMVDSIDSATAYPGMPFRFKLVQTSRIDGVLVPEGTLGDGYVREVVGASNRNRNGSLAIEARVIRFGNRIFEVMNDPREPAILSPAETLEGRAEGYLPIPGILRTAANTVRDGRNITVGPGFIFHVIGLGAQSASAPCNKIGN